MMASQNNMSPSHPMALQRRNSGLSKGNHPAVGCGTPISLGYGSYDSPSSQLNSSILSNTTHLANTSWICNLSPGVQPLFRGDLNGSPAPYAQQQQQQQYTQYYGGMAVQHEQFAHDYADRYAGQNGDGGANGNTADPALPLKPPYSFPCLIGLALRSMPSGRMSVSQIYDYVTKTFPYFRTAKAGWKNSIRHNLSLNKIFCKLERLESEQGKGAMWGVAENKQEQIDRDILQCQQRFPGKIAEAMKEPLPTRLVSPRQHLGVMGRSCSAPAMSLQQMTPGMMHAMDSMATEMGEIGGIGIDVVYNQVKMEPQNHPMMTGPPNNAQLSRALSLPDVVDGFIDVGAPSYTIDDLIRENSAPFLNGPGSSQILTSPNSAMMAIDENGMDDFVPVLYDTLLQEDLTSELSHADLSDLEVRDMNVYKHH